MVGHSLVNMTFHMKDKSAFVAAAQGPEFMPFAAYSLSVDIFFLLSGLLTAFQFPFLFPPPSWHHHDPSVQLVQAGWA